MNSMNAKNKRSNEKKARRNELIKKNEVSSFLLVVLILLFRRGGGGMDVRAVAGPVIELIVEISERIGFVTIFSYVPF